VDLEKRNTRTVLYSLLVYTIKKKQQNLCDKRSKQFVEQSSAKEHSKQKHTKQCYMQHTHTRFRAGFSWWVALRPPGLPLNPALICSEHTVPTT